MQWGFSWYNLLTDSSFSCRSSSRPFSCYVVGSFFLTVTNRLGHSLPTPGISLTSDTIHAKHADCAKLAHNSCKYVNNSRALIQGALTSIFGYSFQPADFLVFRCRSRGVETVLFFLIYLLSLLLVIFPSFLGVVLS